MLVGAIVRNDEVIIPTGASRVEPGDHVIAMVTYAALRKAEAMLGRATDQAGE
jgi:trk system potassium uptake protein TrkA